MEPAQAYQATQARVMRLVSGSDPEAPVPACPGWSVAALVAHLTGLAADVVSGHVEGYATPGWTAAQVTQRSSRTIEAMLGEWSELSEALTARFSGLPAWMPPAIVVDLVEHEHDLRNALGLPGFRDALEVGMAARTLVAGLRRLHEKTGLPALRIDAAGHRSFAVGVGDPAATVRLSTFELLRSLAGRRTRSEVAGYEWHGSKQAFLDSWIQPPFGWRQESLGEG